MSSSIVLADAAARDDLRVFLERLLRAGQPEVRLVTRDAVCAVYGCTQAPHGITDPVPVVLGMRAFSLAASPEDGPVDATVPARSLLDRLARGADGVGIAESSGPVRLELPDTEALAAWAGVLPPAAGWNSAGWIDAASLARVAAEGIERVAAALPEAPGDAVVHRVRSQVWGAEIAAGVPAAAAFAAESLGFLTGEDRARLSRSLTWTRLTTSRGEVMIRSLLG